MLGAFRYTRTTHVMATRSIALLVLLLLAVAQAAAIPSSPPSPPPSPSGSNPLANRNIVLSNTDKWGYGAPHEVVGTTKGFSIQMDLSARDYIYANGTLTPSGIELRSNTRELLAVVFWVAHTPDNTPEAPIYVRGVHTVASLASNATTHFTNGDAVMIEFDADAAPNFTYRGASIAEAANPLLWWTLECKTAAFMMPSPCLSPSLFSNAGWFKAKYGLCVEGTTNNNACVVGGRIESFSPSPPPNPPPPPPPDVLNLPPLDQPPCFAANTPAWRIDADGAAHQIVMSKLRAGDRVLSMDASGAVFTDRVVRNQHVGDTSTNHILLQLRHSTGMLEVTPEHAVYVDGAFMAASSARIGGRMSMASGKEATITAITRTTGGIINPITASGTILAGADGAAVLAGSMPFFAGNYGMRLVALPGPWKMVSALMPDAFQASLLLEAAIPHPIMLVLVSLGSVGVPFPIVAALVGVYDVIVCALFLAGNTQLMGAVVTLALGLAAAKAAMPRRAKAGRDAARA
ncbi:hypothetical protein FOA52_012037 [Chlamydomonas sp. UWO 241]|nr:hypothetical protein FOA52_012037 [Chlamydomonas sp. UWO 241]